MRHYFFDTNDGEHFIRDDQGSDFPSVEAACDAAVLTLPEMARDALHGKRSWDIIATVREATGQTIFKATLSLRTELTVTDAQ